MKPAIPYGTYTRPLFAIFAPKAERQKNILRHKRQSHIVCDKNIHQTNLEQES
jgi:hypothetical protein